MRVSTKGRYGLRVMMELAMRQGGGPAMVADLARAQALPAKYLHVLLGSLRAAGLVRALRGPNGGYELARDPRTIPALEVVEALEGRIQLAPPDEEGATAELWESCAGALSGALRGITLAALADRQRQVLAQHDHWAI
jgi:Rrf2 family cysteine metabolism transcriptional repressor